MQGKSYTSDVEHIEIDFTPKLLNLHLNYFIYIYLHKGEYIFMCDDEEGNSVLIEMFIKYCSILLYFISNS